MVRKEYYNCCWAVHGMQTSRCWLRIISKSGIRLDLVEWVEGMEALRTWLDNRGCSEASMRHRISKANSMFHAKKALFCDPKLPVKRRIDAFYSTCVPAALHGAGEWAYTQSMFQALRICELGKLRRVLCCAGDLTSAGLTT